MCSMCYSTSMSISNLREIEICTGREEAERVFQGSHETIVFTPDSAKKDDSSSTVGSFYQSPRLVIHLR